MDTHILVEAISPVRNGGRTPAAPGDRLLMAPADARALERLGAVRVLEQAEGSSGGEAVKLRAVYYFDESGRPQFLGEFANLAGAAAALEPLERERVAKARARSDATGEEIAHLQQKIADQAAEIEALKASGGGMPFADPAAPPMEAAAPPEPVTPTAPKPVSVDMLRDELRRVATEEGIAWDSNDTKAELVQKIEAGRLTARGAA